MVVGVPAARPCRGFNRDGDRCGNLTTSGDGRCGRCRGLPSPPPTSPWAGSLGADAFDLDEPTEPWQALIDHPTVARVTEAFERTGVELHLVGGSVRDAVRGAPDFADLDFATPATPSRITTIVGHLGSVNEVGAAFGTVVVHVPDGDGGHNKVEITTYRGDTYNPDSRKPDVSYAAHIDDDLARRDLTINALALRLTPGPPALVDPYGGGADLDAGVIRTPADPDRSMSDDPLRTLRVVRFAARYGFRVDPALIDAARRNAGRLSVVSAERKRDEWHKITAAGPAATAAALGHARHLGVIGHLLPGVRVDEDSLWRVASLRDADNAIPLLSVRSGDAGTARRVASALKMTNAETARHEAVARVAVAVADRGGPDVRRLVREHAPEVIDAALDVHAACGRVSVRGEDLRRANTDPRVRAPLPVDGHDAVAAGHKGKAVGAALRRVEDAYLADPGLGRARALRILGDATEPSRM